eukprot:6321245-Pyramimonas_sp.AAC.1
MTDQSDAGCALISTTRDTPLAFGLTSRHRIVGASRAGELGGELNSSVAERLTKGLYGLYGTSRLRGRKAAATATAARSRPSGRSRDP